MFAGLSVSDEKYAFWVVGAGLAQRHATQVKPGALPDGAWIPTLCEQWIRVPFCTPYGRIPASKRITARCPECVETAERGEFRCYLWDF